MGDLYPISANIISVRVVNLQLDVTDVFLTKYRTIVRLGCFLKSFLLMLY